MDKRKNTRTPAGFTLLEILVAMTLMAISITVLVQLFSMNLRNIARSQDYIPAIIAAEAKMSEVLAADTLEEKKISLKTDEGYVVNIEISEVFGKRTKNVPLRLMEVQLTLNWTVDQKEKVFRLHTYKAFWLEGVEPSSAEEGETPAQQEEPPAAEEESEDENARM